MAHLYAAAAWEEYLSQTVSPQARSVSIGLSSCPHCCDLTYDGLICLDSYKKWMNFKKKLKGRDEVNTVKMWLVLILGVAAVVVEGRQFTREPTDTTTTVGDKAVLRFWIPNAFGNIWMS